MWLPAKLRCAKHFFLLQWHFASISLGLWKLFIQSFDFLSFIGSGLTCLSVSYCLLGQDSHVWWFYNWMERPSNTIHLICNISSRRYRHFIFREWRSLRRFIFRRGETYISDIRKNGHFIFWTQEAFQYVFFNDLSSMDWKLQSSLRRACFPSLHLVAYNWVSPRSFSCLS